MNLEQMYKGMPYSPPTTLAQPCSETATEIVVEDGSVFPDAPSIAVLGIDERAETVIYKTKTGNTLGEVERGVQGEAKIWPTGATIARNISEEDFRRIIANIIALNNGKPDSVTLGLDAAGLVTPNDSEALPTDLVTSKGSVLQTLGRLSNLVKRITGKSSWWLTPKKSIETLCSDIDDLIAHSRSMDRVYVGVDLSIKHATEIAGYASVWAWIQARIKAANFTGIHIGDYIPFTTSNSYNIKAEVAGIDTYYRYGDGEVPHHIDFIARDCWPDLHVYNKVNYNNGTSVSPSPWLASDLYAYLNSLSMNVPNDVVANPALVAVNYTTTGVLDKLPTALQNVIITKRALLPYRYTAGALLTEDNSWGWQNMGKLWIPSEIEVYGHNCWGDNVNSGWGKGGFVQYPIFRNNMKRIKMDKDGGTRAHWWLLTADSRNSIYFASVDAHGLGSYAHASLDYIRSPLCFRVA